MAPALVKQCTAEERNSIGKRIFDLSYIPPLSLVCVDQVSIAKNKVFSEDFYTADTTEKSFDPFVKEIGIRMPLPDELCNQVIKKKPSKQNTNFLDNISGPIHQNSQYVKSISEHNKGKTNYQTQQNNGRTLDSQKLVELVKRKQSSIHSKLESGNDNLKSLQKRLQNLQFKHIRSHIVAIGCSNKNENIKFDSKDGDDDLLSKIEKQNRKTKIPKLKEIYDTANTLFDCDTDEEGEEDYVFKAPVAKGKRRSENPPPNSQQLYQWKQKRADVGSKCSWLSLQIENLDKKISTISKLHSQLKLDRQNSKKINHLPNEKLKYERNIETKSNPSDESTPVIGGCSRTHPVALPPTQHKYIRNNRNDPSVTEGNPVCRNMSSILPCHICECSKPKTKNDETLTPHMLDLCFHPSLSYNNDVSLSLLMEETLQKERINTKVTITKLKKKKKQKSKLTPNNNKSKGEYQNSKPLLPKNKNERHRSEDSSRKRSNVSEISGRLRKARKVSETFNYDSSKPPTPTSEISASFPQGQGMKENKFKKKFTSGDFDINNIVIPYSMAASTRLERIQYKEIPTPGWRSIWCDSNTENGVDEELTDDEIYLERHDRCEMNEQKRFTEYFQPNKRIRPNRTTSDCCTSEPPSPMMIDDIRSNHNTPIESPSGGSMIMGSKLDTRLINITQCVESERDPSWTNRTFPLSGTDAEALDDNTSIISPIISSNEPYSSSLTKPINTSSFRHSPFTLISSASTVPKNTPKEVPKTNSNSLTKTTLPTSSENLTSLTSISESDVKDWTDKLINESVEDIIASDGEEAGNLEEKGIVLKLAKQ